jgi:parvulin-like peptidyl-prolyl isomerase
MADVIHEKLEEKILAQVTGPGLQRHVQQIYLGQAQDELAEDAIKVRHILYSPNDDPSGASSVDQADPAWAAAEAEAEDAYERIKADPTLFDSIARTESDEGSALGETGSGGKLPYFDSASAVDPDFLAAIMVDTLEPGDLLEPVRSSFGWHVIQVMYRPPDIDQMNKLKAEADAGEDFATLARDNSFDESAGSGGDIGWIARGQLDSALIDAIFATPIGEVSDVITVEDDGLYLFKVLDEEERTPEGRQLEELRSTAFSDWYSDKKDAVEIERDESIAGSVTG